MGGHIAHGLRRPPVGGDVRKDHLRLLGLVRRGAVHRGEDAGAGDIRPLQEELGRAGSGEGHGPLSHNVPAVEKQGGAGGGGALGDVDHLAGAYGGGHIPGYHRDAAPRRDGEGAAGEGEALAAVGVSGVRSRLPQGGRGLVIDLLQALLGGGDKLLHQGVLVRPLSVGEGHQRVGTPAGAC